MFEGEGLKGEKHVVTFMLRFTEVRIEVRR